MQVFRFMCGVALAALACRGDQPAAGTDGRTPLTVPAEASAAVRLEMRTMLSSLHTILVALPAHDTTAVRGAATAAGMAAAAVTALESLLPEAFMQTDVATHLGFDSLAVAASRGLPPDSLVTRLSRITSNCVA